MGLFIFTAMLFATVPQTDLQKELLQGKVKAISKVYNTTVLETTTYNPQGNLESIVVLFEGETHYTYDSKGRLVSYVATDADSLFSYGTYNTYDASGLLLISESKDTFGNDIGKYEYNAKKQITWVKHYFGDNSFFMAEEYIYDSAGNNIRMNSYDENMKLWAYTLSTYDKNNKLVEKQEFNASDPKIPEKAFKYNADGRMSEETRYYKGAPDTRMAVSYDKYGNITMDEVYFYKKAKTNTTTFTYTYDKQGNWLTREELRDGKFNMKDVREITYY